VSASGLVVIGTAFAYVVRDNLPVRFAEIIGYLSFFSVMLPISAFALTFGQTIILQRKMKAYAGVLIATIALSGAVTYEFTPIFGLAFVAVCESITNALQAVLFAYLASHRVDK
jgi:hypothetical protein